MPPYLPGSALPLWLSKGSSVPIHEQLTTQILLGIMSGDLRPGHKLPSVRELARHARLHPNTVSAAYRELVGRGWLESRRGSGVYVRLTLPSAPARGDAELEACWKSFWRAAQARGMGQEQLLSWVERELKRAPVSRILLLEPEPELWQILALEIQLATGLKPQRIDDARPAAAADLSGAIVVATHARAAALRTAAPSGAPILLLALRSIPVALRQEQRPLPSTLVTLVSRSPLVLAQTRTVLMAAGLADEALVLCDARQAAWQDRIAAGSLVIADVVAAQELPANERMRLLRLLAETSLAELRQRVSPPALKAAPL